MEDFLRQTTSAELTGWLAYLQIDDEAQAQRTAIAFLKAFGGRRQSASSVDEDDEKPIDTTDPEFAKHFRGFTNTPVGRQPQRPMRSTEIKFG